MLKIVFSLVLSLALAQQNITRRDFPPVSRTEVDGLLSPGVNYYEVLGFQSGSSPTAEDIRVRVRELRLRFHPDLAHGDAKESDALRTEATKEEALQLMGKILTAANVLSDSGAKLEYDRHIQQEFEDELRRVVASDTESGLAPEVDLATPDDDNIGTTEPEVGPPPPQWHYQAGAVGVHERTVNRYVRRFKRSLRLKDWLVRALKEHDPMITDPNFHVALKRFLYDVIESKFQPNVMSLPLWRTLLPGDWKWRDYLYSFDTFPFDLLHDFMRALTSDRQVNLAMHLLVLDRIDRVAEPERYYQAIGLTFGWFGDIVPELPVYKLYDVHMTASNMMEMFNDQAGANAMLRTRKQEPFQRLVHRAAIARYISINPSNNRILSEFRIRAWAAGSEIWSDELFHNQDRANVAVLQRLVALHPSEWRIFREELYKMSQDRSHTRYTQIKLNRIYRQLDAVDRVAQRRLRDQQRQREFRERVNRVQATALSWWGRVKQACYNVFWSD